jgi:hypothetical protein
MSTLVWRSRTALLSDRTSPTCGAWAAVVQTVSHDRLTSMRPADWSGPTLLERACRTLFVWERGSRIMDDTVVPTPFATAMEGLAWVFSSQEHQPLDGFSVVLLIWTEGRVRSPLGIRLWHQGGPSQYVLALELLSSARTRLRWHPEYVLFAAWSPANARLQRIRDDGWYFVCRLKKNRRVHGQPLRASRRHPYWAVTGRLNGPTSGVRRADRARPGAHSTTRAPGS